MKKLQLTAIICITLASSAAFGQQTQAITFSGPAFWTPGTTLSLNVFLTFSGYNARGLSYWLEVPKALAPFISITDAQYFTFPVPNIPPGVFPLTFSTTSGARSGYMTTLGVGGVTGDLGATNTPVSPGTYQITRLTFSIGTGAVPGIYTMFTTSLSPRTSEVTDTNFNDNNILPPGAFVVAIGIPEPSTLALLSFGLVGCGVLIYRRKQRN
jgi:hypothetical protein